MSKHLSVKWQHLLIILVVATIAGIINATIIFNLAHQQDYIDEAVSVVYAMSPNTKTIVVDNAEDFQLFSSHSADYEVYQADNLPDSATKVWYIITSNSSHASNSPDELLPNFHVLSEAAKGKYTAYELEKL